jgi:hypothetical protein
MFDDPPTRTGAVEIVQVQALVSGKPPRERRSFHPLALVPRLIGRRLAVSLLRISSG